MRKLTLIFLAASAALIPAAASAEQGRRGPPAGHSWRGGGMHMPGHRPNVVVRHGGGRFHHPGRNFQHRRIQRGFFVHPFWFGPQFHVNNWQVYGFGDPGTDHRWIRYYDDAYMIDRRGRVIDRRENFDWDTYGEPWEVDDGIPAYRGSRDYVPDEEDYAWFEAHGEDGEAYAGHHGGGWDYSQYGHGGYGYGAYGYAYPIIIETTVTTGQTYSEEVIEEYVEVQRPRRRVRRAARPRCACPAPRPAPRPAPPRRPPAGERG